MRCDERMRVYVLLRAPDLMCPPEISNRWPSSSKLTSFASGAAAGMSILQSFDRVAASGVGNSIMNLNLRWKAVSTCAYLFVIATTIPLNSSIWCNKMPTFIESCRDVEPPSFVRVAKRPSASSNTNTAS